MDRSFDVVVIGGGHAGLEAACVSARLGARTALLTSSAENIGVMSCNPAIGGLGKGHLVREVDALDGVMGRLADASGIQFRLLNRRKGAAVRGIRTQADRSLYRRAASEQALSQPNLTLITEHAVDLVQDGPRVVGVLTEAGAIQAGAVVLATGTFLRGMIHVADTRTPAGRVNEAPAQRLGVALEALGLPMGRLKTGTPPRLDGRTIDWAALELQQGDSDPVPFSMMTDRVQNRQVTCGITRTTDETHRVVRDNVERSAMYGGHISGHGPRYCPSIEDKIVRFGDRDGHQIFLEPEALDTPLIYPNGISTSLPADVQAAVVASIPGLRQARIVQIGYAIEYDYVDPRALTPALELKSMPGLFLAGQINGTTGYEEAAAQGLVAGINAARRAGGQAEVVLDRTQSYIGVMIDDLVTRGVTEPYRMFTSRAEYRLSLRSDNADRRLTPLGIALGCVGTLRLAKFNQYADQFAEAELALRGRTVSPSVAGSNGIAVNLDGVTRSAWSLLATGSAFSDLERIWPELQAIGVDVREAVAIEAKYSVYADRQAQEIAHGQRDRDLAIPEDCAFDFPGLSRELAGKLALIRPRNVEHAGRIEGMTPAALALVAAHVRKQRA